MFNHGRGIRVVVKRVVALPGETIEFVNGTVHINGQPLEEPYLGGGPSEAGFEGKVTVPPDNYFVMGDNRGNSKDSRVFGPILRSSIEAVAVRIVSPKRRAHTLTNPFHG